MLPADARQITNCYTFSPADLDLIARRRGEPNRLGFAIQLGFLRYPGRAWTPDESVPAPMLRFIADQVGIRPDRMAEYAARDETRREHLAELLAVFGWRTFGLPERREMSAWLITLARGTDRGLVLVKALLEELRQRRILAPTLSVLDRLASAVRHRARREAYRALTADLGPEQRARLDDLLVSCPDSKLTHLGRLRQTGGASNPANILRAVERGAVTESGRYPAVCFQ